MAELIIFNSRGALLPLAEIEPQLKEATPEVRAAFASVQAAYDADSKVANELKEAIDNVHRLNVELVNLTEYKRVNYRGQTAIEATREYLATERSKVLARN